ncbi:hypothetical protein ACFWFF_12505 [Streptomyces sp. NPDC060223]|uniref:hypothetical protein n=1 Tax=unclassified Streptomyces TaxID=2593676 RepID=UPI00362EA33C
MVVVGTFLAAAAGVLTDNTMAAMALALPLTVLLRDYARFGTQGLYAPTAVLFVLAYGSYTGPEIAHRFLETLLGAAVGSAVNALVFPPVHSRRIRHLSAQLPLQSAELLHDVADGLAEGYSEAQARDWYDRALRLADVVTDLREQRRRSDESYRVNRGLRLAARGRARASEGRLGSRMGPGHRAHRDDRPDAGRARPAARALLRCEGPPDRAAADGRRRLPVRRLLASSRRPPRRRRCRSGQGFSTPPGSRFRGSPASVRHIRQR